LQKSCAAPKPTKPFLDEFVEVSLSTPDTLNQLMVSDLYKVVKVA
jgi:hypothetical protein